MVGVFQALVWCAALGVSGCAIYRSRRVGIPLLFFLVAVAGVSTWALGLLRGPSDVPSRVLQTDRIIYTYEWFFNERATILSYEGQIANTATTIDDFRKDHAGNLDSYANSTELARLQSVLLALRNQMAKDVQEYNAQAMNLTRGNFKDWRLPSSFTISGDKVVAAYE